LEAFNIGISTKERDLLLNMADSNKDDSIDYDEFINFIQPVRPGYLDYSVLRDQSTEPNFYDV
jgi:hypothetical protein